MSLGNKLIPQRTGRWKDAAYLNWIRRWPCLFCDAAPCDPHHVGTLVDHRIRNRTCDYYTIPLCRQHHDYYHAHPGEMAELGVVLRILRHICFLQSTYNAKTHLGIVSPV